VHGGLVNMVVYHSVVNLTTVLQGQAEVPVSEALSFVANQLWLLDVAHIVEIVKSVTSIRSGNK
jgi:hypothetical protein